MNDIDVRNRYDKDTPLHILATIYHTEEEFEAACDILLNVEKPADINAANGRGLTPFYISLGAEQDPGRRAMYLAEKGQTFLRSLTKEKIFSSKLYPTKRSQTSKATT
jgi:hypothetical protein